MLGFHFLKIERRGNGRDAKNVITAQGVIHGQLDASNWMAQFHHAGVPYTNVLETKDLKAYTLFETADQMAAFVAAHMPEAMPKLAPTPAKGVAAETETAGENKQDSGPKKGKLKAVPTEESRHEKYVPTDDEADPSPGGTD